MKRCGASSHQSPAVDKHRLTAGKGVKSTHAKLVEEEKRLALLLKVLAQQNDIKVTIPQPQDPLAKKDTQHIPGENIVNTNLQSTSLSIITTPQIAGTVKEKSKIDHKLLSPPPANATDLRRGSAIGVVRAVDVVTNIASIEQEELTKQLRQISLDNEDYVRKHDEMEASFYGEIAALEAEVAELKSWKKSAINCSSLVLKGVHQSFRGQASEEGFIPVSKKDRLFLDKYCKLLAEHTGFVSDRNGYAVPGQAANEQGLEAHAGVHRNQKPYSFEFSHPHFDSWAHALFALFSKKQVEINCSMPEGIVKEQASVAATNNESIPTQQRVRLDSVEDLKHLQIVSSNKFKAQWISRSMFFMICVCLEIVDEHVSLKILREICDEATQCGPRSTAGTKSFNTKLEYIDFFKAMTLLIDIKYPPSVDKEIKQKLFMETLGPQCADMREHPALIDTAISALWGMVGTEDIFTVLEEHHDILVRAYEKTKMAQALCSTTGTGKRKENKSTAVTAEMASLTMTTPAFEEFCIANKIVPDLVSRPVARRISQFMRKIFPSGSASYLLGCVYYVALYLSNSLKFVPVEESAIAAKTEEEEEEEEHGTQKVANNSNKTSCKIIDEASHSPSKTSTTPSRCHASAKLSSSATAAKLSHTQRLASQTATPASNSRHDITTPTSCEKFTLETKDQYDSTEVGIVDESTVSSLDNTKYVEPPAVKKAIPLPPPVVEVGKTTSSFFFKSAGTNSSIVADSIAATASVISKKSKSPTKVSIEKSNMGASAGSQSPIKASRVSIKEQNEAVQPVPQTAKAAAIPVRDMAKVIEFLEVGKITSLSAAVGILVGLKTPIYSNTNTNTLAFFIFSIFV